METLKTWFKKNRRDFPWRVDPTPYKVWISEVMLQQTRAPVVVPYFEKWVARFPDVETLAAASLEEVIKAWEGLGYYSRARNLHQGAKQLMDRFGGKLPADREALAQIRGLGPYTIGAILSFAFKQRAPAVDGNVTRVLTRFFCIEENIAKQAVKKKIEALAESILDKEEPWVSAEALIELGATICSPKPRCEICPLQKGCLGKEKAEALPIKNKEVRTTLLKRAVLWLEAEGNILVQKGGVGKVMADLYQFPFFEMEESVWPRGKMKQVVRKWIGIEVEWIETLPSITHTFTKYKAALYPFRFRIEKGIPIEGYQWIERERLGQLPFSSGHRRILNL